MFHPVLLLRAQRLCAQVTISYGDLMLEESLTGYGFVAPNNRWASVVFHPEDVLPLTATDPLLYVKIQVLKGLLGNESTPSNDTSLLATLGFDGYPGDRFLGALRLHVLNPEDLRLVLAAVGQGVHLGPQGLPTDAEGWDETVQVLTRLLNQTFQGEDAGHAGPLTPRNEAEVRRIHLVALVALLVCGRTISVWFLIAATMAIVADATHLVGTPAPSFLLGYDVTSVRGKTLCKSCDNASNASNAPMWYAPCILSQCPPALSLMVYTMLLAWDHRVNWVHWSIGAYLLPAGAFLVPSWPPGLLHSCSPALLLPKGTRPHFARI